MDKSKKIKNLREYVDKMRMQLSSDKAKCDDEYRKFITREIEKTSKTIESVLIG